MKSTYYILAVILFISNVSQAQFVHVHTHIINNDQETRAKLLQLKTELGLINGELGFIKNRLEDAKNNHRRQLDLQYKRNKYDKKNSFITSYVLANGPSAGIALIANNANLPYMTKEKRDYLNQVAMDKAILIALQFVSADKIKSSRRQEIYRLRSKLLREYSKNDRDARSLLYLPIGGLLISNFQEFTEMSSVLKALEIAL